jgi:hypothetical protein
MAVVMGSEKFSGILYVLILFNFAAAVRADRIPCFSLGALSVNDKNFFLCTPFRHRRGIAPVIVKLRTRHYTKISAELQAGNRPRYTLNRRMDGSQGRAGRFRKENTLPSLMEIERPFLICLILASYLR